MKILNLLGLMAVLTFGALSVSQAGESCCKTEKACCAKDSKCCEKSSCNKSICDNKSNCTK